MLPSFLAGEYRGATIHDAGPGASSRGHTAPGSTRGVRSAAGAAVDVLLHSLPSMRLSRQQQCSSRLEWTLLLRPKHE